MPREVLARLVNPYFLPVLLVRLARLAYEHRVRSVSRVLSMANRVLFSLEVAPQTKIGPGLYLPHPAGTVVGAASLGANCIVYQNVTIGARTVDIGFHGSSRPTVGDNVVLASGCRVIGPVHIGNGSVIGANAVVTFDVPAGSMVYPPRSEMKSPTIDTSEREHGE